MADNVKILASVLIALGVLTGCGGYNDNQTTSTSRLLAASGAAQVDDYRPVVQQLYVAYFGRPADPNGETSFANSLLSLNAPTDISQLAASYNENSSIKALIDTFGNSTESKRLYGSSNTTAFVTAIFNNVLGRDPKSAGLNFWVGAIDSGQVTQANAALSIMAGALANTTDQGLLDARLIQNHVDAASYFTSMVRSQDKTLLYVGQQAAISARSILSTISASATATSYQAAMNAAIAVWDNIPETTPTSDTVATDMVDTTMAAQVKTRYEEIKAILSSADSDSAKLARLVPYCSADFTLRGKACEQGMTEIMILGALPLDRISAFDLAAKDQFDTGATPTDQNIATVAHNNQGNIVWLWKKAADGKFYLAGDGGMKALIRIFPAANDWSGPGVILSVCFYIAVNNDSAGDPVANYATITGPGISGDLYALVARHRSLAYPEHGFEDTIWPLQNGSNDYCLLRDDTATGRGFYNQQMVQEGVAAGTPYVITLMKDDSTVAVYRQTLRVAPYENDRVVHGSEWWAFGPDNYNYTDTSSSTTTTTLKTQTGATAYFSKLLNTPPISLAADGGTYTPGILLPPGHQVAYTSVWGYYGTQSGSVNTFGQDAWWTNATKSFSVKSTTGDTWTQYVCASLQTFDANGHSFYMSRCSTRSQ